MSVLNAAARHGAPELATDVLRVLKLSGITWMEYHFAALIEAFCHNKQLKEALTTLHIMQSDEIVPHPGTLASIVDFVKVDTETLDSAWAIIDEMNKEKGGVDIEVLKVIIRASVLLGDLQRAVGAYKSLSDYGLQSDVTIFNFLLDGCITAQHRQLGDTLLADMKESKVKPNKETYEKMIRLCLTQEVYEDAFFYLEEMKAAEFIPPQTVYEALVLKCHAMGDTRMDIALEEMQECGYSMSKPTGSKVDSRRLTKEPEKLVGLDEESLEYIKTGGMSRETVS
jgi:pentatricopeptide repeat protein